MNARKEEDLLLQGRILGLVPIFRLRVQCIPHCANQTSNWSNAGEAILDRERNRSRTLDVRHRGQKYSARVTTGYGEFEVGLGLATRD